MNTRGGEARWIARNRWLLDVLVLAVTAVTTAVFGVCLSEAWPAAGTTTAARIDTGHVLTLLIAAVLLILSVLWRWRLRVQHGTLYYVRFLSGWMSDWHLETEREHRRHFLDERVVSRQISSVPDEGVWDVAAQVDELARDLQATMNEDDISTGFLLAPNLLWPAAVALGYQLHPWPGLQVTEFEIPGRAMTFDLHGVSPFAGFDSPVVTPEGGSEASTVLVTVEMTGEGSVTLPQGFSPAVRVRLWFPAGEAKIDGKGRAVAVSTTSDRSGLKEGQAVVHPLAAAAKAADVILSALDDFPNATVYAILRVPKSVAVVIGHRLSGLSTDVVPGTRPPTPSVASRHPWRRLVLLAPDQDAGGPNSGNYHAVRVHSSQPSAATMSAVAKSHGLVLSGAKT